MPYYRRRTSRRRPRRYRPTGRLGKMMKRVANRAITKRAETKFVNIDTNYDVSHTGLDVVHLTAIAQGDNQQNRDGNEVTLSGMRLNFKVFNVTNVDATYQRIWVGYPRSGAYVASPEPFIAGDVFSTVVQDDWITLYDKVHTLAGTSDGTVPSMRSFTVSKKFKKGMNIRYNGSGTTAVVKRPIYIVATQSDGSASAVPATHNVDGWLYFKDI